MTADRGNSRKGRRARDVSVDQLNLFDEGLHRAGERRLVHQTSLQEPEIPSAAVIGHEVEKRLSDPVWMMTLLRQWESAGLLRRVDYELACFLLDNCGLLENEPLSGPQAKALSWLLLGAALCSWQVGRNHVCLDMAALLDDPVSVLGMPAVTRADLSLSLSAGERRFGVATSQGLSQRTVPRQSEEAAGMALLPSDVLGALSLPEWEETCRLMGFCLVERALAPMTRLESTTVLPLVWAGTRLYLRRYWQYEQDLLKAIMNRMQVRGIDADALPYLRPVLDTLFDPDDGQDASAATRKRPGVDWQKVACALAAQSHFGLITGGPGTGKTTTVIRLLALLQYLARRGVEQRFLKIGLAAPTGKAAARLSSSIQGAIDRLPLDRLEDGESIRGAVPSAVSTLHRLLGSRRGSRHFRHDEMNPLPLDVLVIDEASMVSLELMVRVVQALPSHARLILLGDKDQLASVEAGAILGELCSRAKAAHYWPQTLALIHTCTGQVLPSCLEDDEGMLLDQRIAMLRHSHRFSSDSGIGALAEAVNAGDPGQVRQLWPMMDEQAVSPDIDRIVVRDSERCRLRQLVIQGRGQALGYAHYLKVMHERRPSDPFEVEKTGSAVMGPEWDAWADQVLNAHTRFQLLCAIRQGDWGVESLNRQIAQWLQQEGLLPASEGWYPGRPVIVTSNDYELGLMNGDIGICLQTPRGRRVAFPGTGDGNLIRWVLTTRLQAVDTVFAMTVHKAQGSEFDHTALAMPDTMSPVLTRELVYTAITRARAWFTLCGPEGLDRRFDEAIQRQVVRASGLMSELKSRQALGKQMGIL